MSIISKKTTTRTPSRQPPTKALSKQEVEKIQQNLKVEKRRVATEGERKPRPNSYTPRVQRLLCGCDLGSEDPFEPSSSQLLSANRRNSTFADKVSAVFNAPVFTYVGRWRARMKQSKPQNLANNSTQDVGTAEKALPNASTRVE